MKLKTIAILLLVGLLCSAVVSAGFMDWVTGKISLANIFKKKPAVQPIPSTPAVVPEKRQLTPEAPSKGKVSERHLSGDELLTYLENTLKLEDARLGAIEKWAGKHSAAGVRR